MSNPAESLLPESKVDLLDEASNSHTLSQPETVEEEAPGGDMAPSASPGNLNRRASKRKSGKNAKKQQAIDKKLNTLKSSLNPIPFRPHNNFDFNSHEKLLKQLGLWEFAHIQLDQNIRSDLIAELIASYDPKLRCSYVNDFRIQVNRADLGRALKLLINKGKALQKAVEGEDLDGASLSDESIRFIEDFVSNFVLLHEDAWIMPREVIGWTKLIKEKRPEKVDWAGLLWFMVDKELSRGELLGDCYYASHLQCLIKSQREELFSREEPDTVQSEEEFLNEETEKTLHVEEMVSMDEAENVEEDKKEEGESDVKEGQEEMTVFKEPNVELTLGQDIKEDVEMVNPEGHVEKEEEQEEHEEEEEENDYDEEEEEEEEEKEGEEEEHRFFLQQCGRKELCKEEILEEEEEEEEEGDDDGFGVMQNVDTIDGDLLQHTDTTFLSGGNFLPGQSSLDFFYHGSKRGIEDDDDDEDDDPYMATHSLRGNKRPRVEKGEEEARPSDDNQESLGTIIDRIEHLITKAKLGNELNERSVHEYSMQNQYLLGEVHKRDNAIEHISKTKSEEIQKREEKIYQLERELSMMGNILDGYRKALKNTRKEFAEYRVRAQLPEEPIYRDVGPGGLVLSVIEIEKLRLKQEEEFRSNCLLLEMKAREAVEAYDAAFEMLMQKVLHMGSRLTSLSDDFNELKNKKLSKKR
ncbi:unnamed protein product [Cuscuta epithymum]|nr:unnamed protein product [Cuscuta epithymum]CAH9135300.1 unnamed protein product [Cuscuta epithymum]